MNYEFLHIPISITTAPLDLDFLLPFHFLYSEGPISEYKNRARARRRFARKHGETYIYIWEARESVRGSTLARRYVTQGLHLTLELMGLETLDLGFGIHNTLLHHTL
jgi:hypothetical protein